MNRELYLDEAATTEVDKDAADVIYKTMLEVYGNPSTNYEVGKKAKKVIKDAEQEIIMYLGGDPERDHVIFTGGASEANTLALNTSWNGRWAEIITDNIEHSSIRNNINVRPTDIVGVNKYGTIDCNELDKTIRRNLFSHITEILVSIQYANNEIGTIQDIEKISNMCWDYGTLFHVDATQAFPYIRGIIKKYPIDMITFSGHKIHGPKGIGVLYVNRHIVGHDFKFEPIIYGGQQMYGVRGGTENVPYIAGLGYLVHKMNAMSISEQDDKMQALYRQKHELEGWIYDNIKGARINGCILDHDLAGTLNVSFRNVDGQTLLLMLDAAGIYVSAGSACNTDASSREPSFVLRAIKVPEEYIWGTIRISFGDKILNTDEMDYLETTLKDCVAKCRKLYEMEN